ncbi:MAG: hypothetical protein IPJ77_23610 [Planctomycetes bacterium]|nr:hypothetical protein [Planctomycetota bacterium]
MKISVRIALALIPALVLAACGGKESSAASESAKSTLSKAKDAAVQAKDELATKMRAWQDSSKTSLDQFDTKLDEWRASAKEKSGAEKDRLDELLRDLEPKRKELAEKFAEVERGGADAWAKLQPEIDRLLAEAKKRYDAATQ